MYNSNKIKRNSMPVLTNQLNHRDISNDFNKFYNENQDDLLSLLNQFINIRILYHFLIIGNIIHIQLQKWSST